MRKTMAAGVFLGLAACGDSPAAASIGLCPGGSPPPELDHTIGEQPSTGCSLAGGGPSTTALVLRNHHGERFLNARFIVRDPAGRSVVCVESDRSRFGECSLTEHGVFHAQIVAPVLTIEMTDPVQYDLGSFCPDYERSQPNGPGCSPVVFGNAQRPLVVVVGPR